jgi:DNA-3-methyladenine glycosylase II
MPVLSDIVTQEAEKWLSNHDPVLARLIASQPSCNVRPHENYFQELVEAIISQQLNVRAAASITARFVSHFGTYPSPQQLHNADQEALRALGLSYAKIRYIKDLAQHVLDKKIQFKMFENLSNKEIQAQLLPVKGIGEWTVHMFLLFCMARSNVLAVGDLGIRKSLQNNYHNPDLPNAEMVQATAERGSWAPYESVACWHLWRSLDNKPV